MKRVNFKKKPYDVYIGRPSKWGNNFSSKPGTLAAFKVSSRSIAIKKHREWVLSQPGYIDQIKKELAGKILGCWCDENQPCHGDVYLEIANDLHPNLIEEDLPPNQKTLWD
jgi:hypothetical protein